MDRWLILLMLIIGNIALAETIYKSIDESGNVIYSDQVPQDASEQHVHVQEGNVNDQDSQQTSTTAYSKKLLEEDQALQKKLDDLEKQRTQLNERMQQNNLALERANAILGEEEIRLLRAQEYCNKVDSDDVVKKQACLQDVEKQKITVQRAQEYVEKARQQVVADQAEFSKLRSGL